MQFAKVAAVLSFAAAARAWSNDTIVWTTIVVDSYTTVCPASTTAVVQGVTYTNTLTESSTITVTNCPCTVSAPVKTVSSVYCVTCAVPTTAPVFTNHTTTAAAVPVPATSTPVVVASTTAPAATTSPSAIPASGANKAFAMSGASLAGLLGLAAYLL